jgi:hypothetical protein
MMEQMHHHYYSRHHYYCCRHCYHWLDWPSAWLSHQIRSKHLCTSWHRFFARRATLMNATASRNSRNKPMVQFSNWYFTVSPVPRCRWPVMARCHLQWACTPAVPARMCAAKILATYKILPLLVVSQNFGCQWKVAQLPHIFLPVLAKILANAGPRNP